MNTMAVCKGCGRTIDGKFSYCPWCGRSKVAVEEESLDVLFKRFEEKQKNARRQQLYEMKKELESMENELSMLVLSAEMHK